MGSLFLIQRKQVLNGAQFLKGWLEIVQGKSLLPQSELLPSPRWLALTFSFFPSMYEC